MQDVPTLFSEDYQSARKSFCDAALSKGWSLQSHQRDGGRDGELFTDIARIGAEHPRKLFVLSSALHGVEGFLGSAIQRQLLETLDIKQIENSQSAILIVHALNPFGFARIRRFDEKNVDVNRNFLLPGEDYSGSHPFYRQLDSLLNPKKWSKWELPPHVQALIKILPYGVQNLQQAIAQGQYDYPLGLFFGGNEPSSTMQMIQETLLPEFQQAQEVLHLDVHTGLGKRGDVQLLYDYQLQQSEENQLQKLFGKQFKINNVSEHYEAVGSFYRWLRNHAPQTATFCWEFGTYGPITVLDALRSENAASHWSDRGSKSFVKAKEKLKEAFCPQSPKWRTQVLNAAQEKTETVVGQWLLK
ncbi:M14 family metallopeptidase [bacterium]|jgi:hypothetical protein|nr:DUF2817 domain-containing protein [Planctomicrobium sp.]MDB4793169.1 M14 family metallopeptidase [bacterium]